MRMRAVFSLSDRLRHAIAVFWSAAVLTAEASAQFEGIVESKNLTTDETGKPQEFVMTMWIKKDMVRIETRGGTMPGSTMIYRTDKHKIWMLNDEEKTYFEISQDEKPEEIFGGGSAEKYVVKRTGKTKTIAGYPCEQFLIKRSSEVTEVWGTKKLGFLASAITKALGQEHFAVTEGPTAEMMKRGIYPLASATKVEGSVIESQEVTRIEAKVLDESLFTLPPEYTKQKSVDMMQGIDQQK